MSRLKSYCYFHVRSGTMHGDAHLHGTARAIWERFHPFLLVANGSPAMNGVYISEYEDGRRVCEVIVGDKSFPVECNDAAWHVLNPSI